MGSATCIITHETPSKKAENAGDDAGLSYFMFFRLHIRLPPEGRRFFFRAFSFMNLIFGYSVIRFHSERANGLRGGSATGESFSISDGLTD